MSDAAACFLPALCIARTALALRRWDAGVNLLVFRNATCFVQCSSRGEAALRRRRRQKEAEAAGKLSIVCSPSQDLGLSLDCDPPLSLLV